MDTERWLLYIQAVVWRNLMGIGMFLHRLGRPRPMSPRFTKSIPTNLAKLPGRVRLLFYTPKDYGKPGNDRLYPVIVNFHGGGFTLGTAKDDARWATAVVQQTDSVVCSVDYRRAPEHPFPTGVEDGADVIMYLWDNAKTLHLDPDRLGVSGFSAGGNMSFTVPLRLQDALLRRRGAEPPEVSSDAKKVLPHEHSVVKIIVAWYPTTDYTHARAEKQLTNARPDKEIPHFFDKLFDDSYLHPPKDIKMDSPYLSPGVASDELLTFMPEDIVMYTCEWDELHAEGERFRERLKALGKTVRGKTIMGVPHAWDRSPNPFHHDPIMDEVYKEACDEIKRVFSRQ